METTAPPMGEHQGKGRMGLRAKKEGWKALGRQCSNRGGGGFGVGGEDQSLELTRGGAGILSGKKVKR